MKLGSADSAILSAVIFNAIIIVMLIPLALQKASSSSVSVGRVLRDATC